MAVVMDREAIVAFLEAEFPQALAAGFELTRVDEEGVALRLPADEAHLRPGGTVMGPTLMMLADTAAYFAILSQIGPVGLAVTTSLQIHFLAKAPPGEVTAQARLLKLGRRLAVSTVDLRRGGDGALVAHATVTYSLP